MESDLGLWLGLGLGLSEVLGLETSQVDASTLNNYQHKYLTNLNMFTF